MALSTHSPPILLNTVASSIPGVNLHTQNGKTFIIVHMTECYMYPLLERFYNEVMVKFFPIKEELDPIETWIRNLRNSEERAGNGFPSPYFDVCIIMDPQGSAFPIPPASSLSSSSTISLDPSLLKLFDHMKIVGGSVAEYFPLSHCGLLTYFVVLPEYRPYKFANFLSNVSRMYCLNIFQSLQQSSSAPASHSSYEKHFCFLAETNAAGVEDGVVPSAARHRALNRLGFRCLDMDYIQAPVSDEVGPCTDLILLAIDDDFLPRNHEGKRFVPAEMMRAFVSEFTYSCTGSSDFESEDYYLHMAGGLKGRDQVVLMEIPWLRKNTFSSPSGSHASSQASSPPSSSASSPQASVASVVAATVVSSLGRPPIILKPSL